jgi:hypothetical protein
MAVVADVWGWHGWAWDGWEALVAVGTIFLGFGAYRSARETLLQRRNLTRPELVDIPPDSARAEEAVEFGEDYSLAKAIPVPTTELWFGAVESDLGNWVCTLPLRNTGTGSAKLLESSLSIRGPSPLTIEGHRRHQFVPPKERVRLVFYTDAPVEPDVFTEGLWLGAELTVTVSYADFEEGDVYKTTVLRGVSARGGEYQDVQVARVGGGAIRRTARRRPVAVLAARLPRRLRERLGGKPR